MHVCFVLRWKLHLDNEKSNFPHFPSFFPKKSKQTTMNLLQVMKDKEEKYQPANVPIIKVPLFSPATQKFMAAL